MRDPLSQSALAPRKHFVFDPYKVLAGGVIFILSYFFPLRALVFRILSPVLFADYSNNGYHNNAITQSYFVIFPKASVRHCR